SVCSPYSGDRDTSVGESDSLIGLPTVKYLPRLGWSTSTTVPVLRREGSSASSFIERIGPHGTFSGLSVAITSILFLVMVHFSISPNTSPSLGRRASGVLKFGSSSQSAWPITLASV